MPRSGRRGPASRVILLACGLFAGASAQTTASYAVSKPVEVTTWAPWPSFPHSLLLETGEFLAEEDPSGRLFWKYTSAVARSNSSRLITDPESATKLAFNASADLLSPLSHDVLRLAVQSRAYSPVVELHRSLATTSSPGFAKCGGASSTPGGEVPAWADVSTGVSVCSAGELKTLIRGLDSGVSYAGLGGLSAYHGDHWYEASSPSKALGAEGRPLVIVYGALGSPAHAAMHAVAAKLASAGSVRYIARHFPGDASTVPGASSRTWLAGYGVGFDVKSTEYKFLDDRAAAGQGGDKEAGGGGDGALAGMASVMAADSTLPPLWLTTAGALLGGGANGTSEGGGGEAAVAGVYLRTLAARLGLADDTAAAASPSAAAVGKTAKKGGKKGKKGAAAAAPATPAPGAGAGGGTLSVEALQRALASVAASTGSAGVGGCGGRHLCEAKQEPWTASRLGLQAAAFIMDAAVNAATGAPADPSDPTATDPLARLAGVASNFPSLAAFLSSLPVPPSLAEEVEANARSLGGAASVMQVNGISIDPASPTFNLFALFNVLRAEAHVTAALDTLPLSPADKRRVANLAVAGSKEAAEAAAAVARASSGSSSGEEGGAQADEEQAAGGSAPQGGAQAAGRAIRLDVLVDPSEAHNATAAALARGVSPAKLPVVAKIFKHAHPIVAFLNDVEADESYARWPSALSTLMQPSWQLHQLRRNLYTTLLVADFASPPALRSLAAMGYFVQMRIPIRFGPLPLPGASTEEASALARDASGAFTQGSVFPSKGSLPLSSPALGLHVAMLHASAVMRYGGDVGSALLVAVGNTWRAEAEAAQMAAGGEGASPAAAAAALESPLSLGSLLEAYTAALTAGADLSRARALDEGKTALVDSEGVMRAAVLAVSEWASSRGLSAPSLVVNGRVKAGTVDVQTDLMPLVSEELQLLQRAVVSGSLDDGVAPGVYEALLGRATRLTKRRKTGRAAPAPASAPGSLALPGSGMVVARFHPAIFAGDDEQRFLPLSAPEAGPLVSPPSLVYVHAPGTFDDVKPVSLTLFDDLSSQPGLANFAALLAFVRAPPPQAHGAAQADDAPPSLPTCVTSSGKEAADPASCPVRAPERMRAALSRSLRVGALHVPALTTAGYRKPSESAAASGEGADASTDATVGTLLSALISLATGSVVCDGAQEPAFTNLAVRPDERASLVGDLVDIALGVVTDNEDRGVAGGLKSPPGHLAAVFANAVMSYAKAQATSSATQPRLRPKVAERLASAVPRLLRDLSEPKGAAAAACVGHMLRNASATADLARRLLPDALPAARTIDAASGALAVRALAANGRVLALAPAHGGVCHPSTSGAAFTLTGASASSASESSSPVVLSACVGPLDAAVLALHERQARGSGVAALLSSVGTFPGVDPDDATAEWMSGVAMMASSAVGGCLNVVSGNVGGRATGRVALRTSQLQSSATHFVSRRAPAAGASAEADAEGGSVGLTVTAIIDPVSEAAQRIAPLLLLLRDRLGAEVHVHLMPPPSTADLPLKSFYRFVMPADDAVSWARPAASFAWLPPSSILTLKHYVPEAWNTQAARADVDTDNLQLRALPPGGGPVGVEYWLKDLLVAGQCMDQTSRGFPNGLQLVLRPGGGNASSAPVSDTLVMQNLGYWQLKARPGVWGLSLAEGRASQLFSIVVPAAALNETAVSPLTARSGSGAGGSAGGDGGYANFGRRSGSSRKEDEAGVESLPIVVRDFTGPVTQLTVRKRPGHEEVALLEAIGAAAPKEGAAEGEGEGSAATGGLLSSLSRKLFGSGSTPNATATANASGVDDRETIHVFSLASGHLYERFLKIMMLSAVKRTTSAKLKFWLLENTLSPQFKDSAQRLAARNGFEVAFVTYKWPNWLRQQTEKQRIIWGYKILFLDVLFPLNLTKVIYIDSDQVVRSDLGELWHRDLQGAPYGYTPFCDSRQETLGYQFWRSGYWKDHLAGRPYHISALYVVDLLAFRRAAVGDQLRAIYDTLSRDPASLSNLDQDLPNYAQTHIPIHSLPQEWLWCESWCSDESKATAKTIDLCNNPRFKEPKLDMARRVISGELFPESWNQLDAEVAANEAQSARERESEASAAAVGAPEAAPSKSASTSSATGASASEGGSTGLVILPSSDSDADGGDSKEARRKRRRARAAEAGLAGTKEEL